VDKFSKTPDDAIKYFTASTFKLIFMSIVTFGLYNIYWFYKNWLVIKKFENTKIMPFWRALFSSIFAYFMFKRIQKSAKNSGSDLSIFPVITALAYFAVEALGHLPEPYWFLYLFSVLLLIPANAAATKVNQQACSESYQNEKIKGWNWLAVFIGVTLLSLNIIASTPTFSLFLEAEELYEAGDFEKSREKYSKAIKEASKSTLFGFYEYEIRASYGFMLNELSNKTDSAYFIESRQQFEWIIEYLDKNPELISTKAQAITQLAFTYQQEAAYTESEEEYYQLLEMAYKIYKEAAQQLEVNQDWRVLASTFYNIGKTSEWYGDLDEAIKWLEKAVEIDKKYGFEENLKEDSEYLIHLKNEREKMLNTREPSYI